MFCLVGIFYESLVFRVRLPRDLRFCFLGSLGHLWPENTAEISAGYFLSQSHFQTAVRLVCSSQQ